MERRFLRRRRGVVLILTLFVLLISYALIAQLTLGTEVASSAVAHAADEIRIRASYTSAAQQILDSLRDDLPSAGGGAGGTGADAFGGGGAPMGSDPAAPGGAPAGSDGRGGEDGEGEEDDGSNSDSWEDAWAKPMRIQMDDIVMTAWVEDENGKFNLYQLVAEDEDYREQARNRCVRILDFLREDLEEDLDESEARTITNEIVEWLEGRSRSREYPRPQRFSNPEDGERTLMSSLEELLMLEHVTPELFYDQIEDEDTILPGLESVFTIWTTVALESAENGNAATGGADGAGGEAAGGDAAAAGDGAVRGGAEASLGGLGAAQGPGAAPSSGGSGQEPAATGSGSGGQAPGGTPGGGAASGMIGTKLNLNTMPKAVLQALLPTDELSSAAVNEILEYRNKVDEEELERRREEDLEPEERALQEALYGDLEPEPKLYFKSTGDLEQIETFQERTDQEVRTKFLELVGVQSDVFSVYLFAHLPLADWRPASRYDEPKGQVLRLRAVVWRRNGQNGAEFVYLQNWHEVPFTRWRIPDFQDDLPPFRAPEF